MKVWRIAGTRHPVFDGTGAALYPGRWNGRGQGVIYCGSSFAIALLERLCYTALGRAPRGDRYVEVDLPSDAVETFDAAAHPGWERPNSDVALAFGRAWLLERRSLALRVPSAVTRIDWNVVINADHPDMGVLAVSDERPFDWDVRLFVPRLR